MLTKQKTVGIRVPDNPICIAIIESLENPLLNTSAKESDENPVVDAIDVAELFANRVDLIIDGGPVYPDQSTVVSLIDDQPEIIRHGKGDISSFI